MTGLIPTERADQAPAEQKEIADRVEHLVLDELVVVPQAVFVENTAIVNHYGVVEAAAEREVLFAQQLDIAGKTEGARATHFFNERRSGKIHDRFLAAALEYRMIEVDGERHLEAFKGIEARPLVALVHFHGLLDADKTLRRVLLFHARGLNQKHERPGAAVHDRHFGRAEIDVGIVDAETRERGQQMLDRRDAHITVDQCCRQGGFTDVFGAGSNLDRRFPIDAAEHDACIHCRRPQGEIHLFPAMEADSGGPYHILQRSLLDHPRYTLCLTGGHNDPSLAAW